MIGIDPIRYAFFIRNTPQASWSVSGKAQVVHWGTYDVVSEEAFAEMVDFLNEYALRVGIPAKPNGKSGMNPNGIPG
jgi:hypothetical protein